MMAGYYDMDGKPMPLMKWAKRFEDMTESKERQIGSSKLWFGLVHISTVWLGIDHDFSWPIDKVNPNPIIFESMIFIRGRGYEMRRYSTKEQALAGHADMVRLYRNPINLFKMWREWR